MNISLIKKLMQSALYRLQDKEDIVLKRASRFQGTAKLLALLMALKQGQRVIDVLKIH